MDITGKSLNSSTPTAPVSKSCYVLDTGAFLSRLHPTDGSLYTIAGVKAEIRPAAACRYFEQLEASGTLAIREPNDKSLEKVRAAAKATGDLEELSPTDVQLMALTVELKAVIVTSDHRMQNVASALALPFKSITEGQISEQWQWIWRCRGCGRYFEDGSKVRGRECPVCGSELRKRRQR